MSRAGATRPTSDPPIRIIVASRFSPPMISKKPLPRKKAALSPIWVVSAAPVSSSLLRLAAAIAGANTQSTPKIRSGIPKTTGPYLTNMICLPELIIRIGAYSLWMTCRCKVQGKKKPRFGGASSTERKAYLDFASLRALASSMTVVATLAGQGK